MPIDKRTRARLAAVAAFLVCLPVGFYAGITSIGHAGIVPHVSTSIDRLILAVAILGLPALAAFATHRFVLAGSGALGKALFWAVGGALALASVAFVGFLASLRLESAAKDRIVANTRVGDMRDEPVLSHDGRAIGVRVAFAIALPAPRSGHEINAWLASRHATIAGDPLGLPGLSIDAKRARLEGGKPIPWSGLGLPVLAPGRHEISFELYPDLVRIGADGEPCASSPMRSPLPDSAAPDKYRIVIGGTAYGAGGRSGEDGETRNAYDVVGMYRAVLDGAIRRCPE